MKHSVTALKFAQKIREAIQKRMAKTGRRPNRGKPETVLGRVICVIENELTELKQKLAKTIQ